MHETIIHQRRIHQRRFSETKYPLKKKRRRKVFAFLSDPLFGKGAIPSWQSDGMGWYIVRNSKNQFFTGTVHKQGFSFIEPGDLSLAKQSTLKWSCQEKEAKSTLPKERIVETSCDWYPPFQAKVLLAQRGLNPDFQKQSFTQTTPSKSHTVGPSWCIDDYYFLYPATSRVTLYSSNTALRWTKFCRTVRLFFSRKLHISVATHAHHITVISMVQRWMKIHRPSWSFVMMDLTVVALLGAVEDGQ